MVNKQSPIDTQTQGSIANLPDRFVLLTLKFYYDKVCVK